MAREVVRQKFLEAIGCKESTAKSFGGKNFGDGTFE